MEAITGPAIRKPGTNTKCRINTGNENSANSHMIPHIFAARIIR